MDLKEDIRLAQNARRNSYVKENGYSVGVVIKSKSGRKYTGCNIEIDSLNKACAEKVALEKAISEGEKEFEYMVIIAGKKNQESEKYLPCEDCKKNIMYFVDDNFKIYIVYESKIEEYKLKEFLNK